MVEINITKRSIFGMAKKVNANDKNSMFGGMTPRKHSRVAGVLYLLVIIFGVTAELIRQSIIVDGDAMTTASNIMANETMFQLSIISDVLMLSCFALLPIAFYMFLSKINKNHARFMVIAVLVSIPVSLIALTYQLAALNLVIGSESITAGIANQVVYNMDMYASRVFVAQVFHGLWLLPLGYLVYRSGYFPKVFGILVVLAGVGFMIDSARYFIVPDLTIITGLIAIFTICGEFGLTGWLLVKGAKVQEASAA